VDPTDPRIASNPRLVGRLDGSVHDYFRFVNVQFSERVCRAFSSSLAVMPDVNLHGDAHLEQYAVTDDSHGLYDFDDASKGPAVLDLVRMSASVLLTVHQHQWPERDGTDAIDAFLEAYRTTLEDRSGELAVPAFAARMRREHSVDHQSFLADADVLMQPLSDESRHQFEATYRRYEKLLLVRDGKLSSDFLAVKRVGSAHSGIGSALDKRFLIRIEGPTAAGDDDIILEAKATRDLVGISCVQATATRSPFRVLLGQSRIGTRQDRFLAAVPPAPEHDADAAQFWMQSWDASYQEVRIMKTISTREELLALARDVGAQLGRGHIKGIAAPYDADLCSAQLALLEHHRALIRSTARDLADETLEAWKVFRQARR